MGERGRRRERKRERERERMRISFFLNFFNAYSFLSHRERQSMSRKGAEREGDTESEAGSSLRAVSAEPGVGLELTNREIMT